MTKTEGTMSSSTTLHIQDPPQYDVTIENENNLQQSILLDMYHGAARNVDAIIERNKTVGSNSCEPTNPDASINTTIAFVGGRGTGKSSAMQSFSNYLQKGPKTGDGVWQSRTNELPKFVALPTIDSSQISEHETVIGRMSAAMLAGFRKEQKSLSLEKRQEFLSCAKEVNELAVLLQTGEWFKCGDKLLTNTERICGMKASVRKLVDSYLSVVCKENAYLIITIDDLDMGIKSAYAIMEEIRQYLSIPRVVVLVSIDETLLDAVVRTSINESMKVSNPDEDHKVLVKDLSYRYLEKLFPVNRRHHTPRLTSKQLREWKSEGFIDYVPDVPSEEKLDGNPLTVRNAILHLIWRKTMLIPVCNRDGDHLLIPRNLRSLCHMVVLLRSMPDIAYKDASGSTIRTYSEFQETNEGNSLREKLRHNLNVFGKYIVDNLASYGAPQLSTKNEAAMASVLETVIRQMQEIPLDRMNAMIVGDILYYVEQTAEERDTYKKILGDAAHPKEDEKEHCDMLSPAIQYPDSISLGDVMYVLGKLDSRSKCTYIRYLVEVIRILWSIRMTEEFYVNGTTENAQIENGNFFTTKDFRCAVGGSFVNPDCVTDLVNDGGWVKYDDIYRYSADFAKFLILYRGNKDPQMEVWRDTRSDGGPYYKVEKPKEKSNIWCNLFAVYNRFLTEKGEWQQEHIMALPFYSFDFMYRYYEELHEKFRVQNGNCIFWEAMAILLMKDKNEVSVFVDNLKLQGMATEKKAEIKDSLSIANAEFRNMLIAVGDRLKVDILTDVSDLIELLKKPEYSSMAQCTWKEIQAGSQITKETLEEINKREQAISDKLLMLFTFDEKGLLSSPITLKKTKYKVCGEADTLKNRIEVWEGISDSLSPSSQHNPHKFTSENTKK